MLLIDGTWMVFDAFLHHPYILVHYQEQAHERGRCAGGVIILSKHEILNGGIAYFSSLGHLNGECLHTIERGHVSRREGGISI